MEERLRRGSSIWMPAAAGAELLHRGKTVWQEIRNSGYLAFWTFFAGGIAGYCLETIWCWFAFGGFSSRTSNLFFPFSIVWAVGAVLIYIFTKEKQDMPVWKLFIRGCVFCGLFEACCGYLGEFILGVTFWDYSALPLHIGRYVDVLICLVWGGLCVVWVRWVAPRFGRLVRYVRSRKIGRAVTCFLLCFMIGSNLISGLALLRMESRDSGAAAETGR